MKNLIKLVLLVVVPYCPLQSAQLLSLEDESSHQDSMNSASFEPGSEYTQVKTQNLKTMIQRMERLEREMKQLKTENRAKGRVQKKKRAKQRKENKIALLKLKIENQPNCLSRGIIGGVGAISGGLASYKACAIGMSLKEMSRRAARRLARKAGKEAVKKAAKKYAMEKAATHIVGIVGGVTVGVGLHLAWIAYDGHKENVKEKEDIEKEIGRIERLPIYTRICNGGFMSDSENEDYEGYNSNEDTENKEDL